MIRQKLRPVWRRIAGSGRWRRLLGNRRAGVAVITAISFPVLLGFVGLASEAGMWLVIKRSMQGAADAAAYSGAVAKYEGAASSRVCNEALAVAARNGYPSADPSCNANSANCANQICVQVNSPPTSGSHTATSAAVEVIIKQPQTASIAGFLSGFYRLGAPNVTVAARAVAGASQPGDCVLALDTNTADNGILSDGNSNAVLGCGFADNASLQMNGTNTVINATGGAVRGSVNPGNGTLTPATPAALPEPVSDPYANNIPAGACAGCTSSCGSGTTLSSTQAVAAGVYCCGLKLTGPPDNNQKLTVTGTVNGAVGVGNNLVKFQNGVNQAQVGWAADDWTTLGAVPDATYVTAISNGNKQFTFSNNVSSPGVADGDTVTFTAAAMTSAASAPGSTTLTFASAPLAGNAANSPGTLTVIDLTNPGAIPAGTTASLTQLEGSAAVTLSKAVVATDAAGDGVLGGDLIEFAVTASYTMNGTYTICGGKFSIEGSASLNAGSAASNPVTIVLTGNGTTGYAIADIAGGATVNLTAPSSGSYAGLAIYQDSNTPSSTRQSKILGGSSTVITGAIDFGTTNLLYNGNSSTTTPCTQIIGSNIELKGTSNIQDLCNGTGVKPIKAVALVE